MKQTISRPLTYTDIRRCIYGCCNSSVLGMRKILQEQEGGPSCIVQEFIKDTHGYACSIRGYNIYFNEPIVVSSAMCVPGEDSADFVDRMRHELRLCARETSITTWTQSQDIGRNGHMSFYRWGVRDGKP